ncbi:hypothetical protein D778_01090 [Xanthomarina gelatinilytica]|uniref:Uncharacterized protein n=1 Tax=Xanthomarina gelatinilytica TaxID=1137281 RepID=M7N6M1_9FLAO|nr:hypothetical protein D778_01090 [Xanthomarina gelatinilytica]
MDCEDLQLYKKPQKIKSESKDFIALYFILKDTKIMPYFLDFERL